MSALTLVYYFVPEDNETEESMNVFAFPKQSSKTLRKVNRKGHHDLLSPPRQLPLPIQDAVQQVPSVHGRA